MKHFNKLIIHFLLISVAVLGLYWPTTKYGFVLDDKMVISENNFVKEGIKGVPDIWNNDSMTGYLGKQMDLLVGGRYRPLSLIVFAIAYDFWNLDSYSFHLLNLIFYLVACLIFYITLLNLFRLNKSENIQNRIYIFVASLLFAIHPIHTEAVANIKGLDEILSFLFGILSLLFILNYSDKKKVIFLGLGGLSFLLGLLAKESILPLLIAIPAALYFFRDSSLKTVFYNFVILLVPTIIYLIIRNNALGFLLNNEVNFTGIMNNPYLDASLSQKTGTILFTLLLYIKLLFFPHPLTHDYYPYHIKLIEVYHPFSLLSLIFLGFLIWVAIKGIKQRNKLSWIIFYFFITISIVSNVLINVGTFMNERFLFLPSLAFSAMLIYAFEKFETKTKIKNTLFVLSTLYFLGFSFQTYARIPDWENEITLNKAAVKISKNSARANCFYGVNIYNQILKDSVQEVKLEKITEARKYINRSLEIYPEYADALRMKAGLAAEDYKIDNDADKLLTIFEGILKVRDVAYVDEFINWLERRTDKRIMADYYYKVGYNIFAVEKRNFSKANFYLQKGIALVPNHQNLLFANCIIAYLTTNNAKAIEYGTTYLTLYGENPDVLFYCGNAQIKSGNPQVGLQNLEKAYKLKPELKNQKTN